MILRKIYGGARVAALAFFLFGVPAAPATAQESADTPATEAETAAVQGGEEPAPGEGENGAPSVDELLNRIE